jgi:hypothetical protein
MSEEEAYAAFWDDYDWRNGAPIEEGSQLDIIRQQFPRAWKRFVYTLKSERSEGDNQDQRHGSDCRRA